MTNPAAGVGAGITIPGTAGPVPSGGIYPLASSIVLTARVTGDTDARYELDADGTQKYGSGAGVADVVTARTGAGVFGVTTGSLTVASDITARLSAATQVVVGADGSARAAVLFGAAGDAAIARSGVAALLATGSVAASTDITARSGAATQVRAGAFGPTGQAAVVAGAAADTDWYRNAAAVWRTSGSVTIDLDLVVTRDAQAKSINVTPGNGAVQTGFRALYGSGYQPVIEWLTSGSYRVGLQNPAGSGALVLYTSAAVTPPTDLGGSAMFMIQNATAAAPAVAPVGGGGLFVVAGALKYIGTAGTVTNLAPA